MPASVITDWINAAPDDVKSWLTSITVINFLTAQRNKCFQMAGQYDGAMSKECTESFKRQYEAVNEILGAIGDLLVPCSPKPSGE